MTEIQRLVAAIAKISEVYLVRLAKAGDKEGLLRYSLRLADYATRLAVLVGPPLAAKEAAELYVPEPVSSDPSVAVQQILAATGHPLTFGPSGETLAIDGASVIADATPQQQRELALLGFFGQPATNPSVDWSLFLRYYEPMDELGNWTPKEAYAFTGTWQGYLAEGRE